MARPDLHLLKLPNQLVEELAHRKAQANQEISQRLVLLV
jgi:hypothetical protein